MKNIIFIVVFFSLSSFSLSQNHIFYLNQRFGVATNQSSIPPIIKSNSTLIEEVLSDKKFRLRYDVGTLFGYEYKLFKSTNTYFYTAFESSKSRHDFNLNNLTIENIDVTTRRNVIHLGFRQRFSAWDDQLRFGFGFGLAKRFFPEDKRTYLHYAEYTSETNIINWEYRLTTFHDGHHTKSGFISNKRIMNAEVDIFSTLKINDYLNFRFNFMYSRNYRTYYLLGFTSVNQFVEQGYSQLTQTEGYIGVNNSKEFTSSHNFYTSIGLEFNLGELFHKLKTNE